MALVSLLLLAALLPYLSHSASVNVEIVNGTVAKPHSRPYMVSVQANKNHMCGGFLVSPLFVMTAAHCWASLKETGVTAVIGAHDLNANDFDCIPVKEHYIHPNFTHGNNPSNDIMLLKLGRSAKNSKNAALISIPKITGDVNEGTLCSVAGWGRTRTNGTPSNVLLEAKIRVLSNNQCKAHWDYKNILCAGGLHQGFCMGDSGGPLVCNSIAVGIASFFDQNNCDTPKKPNGYTKISAFLPWIRGIIQGTK
ncbi:mast cell protease 2-like [Colossoma macropomum]|uniref:mast cell protease 2-like n=1 Tax=Colossoma macropomum TaxID=42526 RepID=UPI0018652B00|nr:mast cell protease 2-like [Colossoma macropomum]